MKHLRYSLAALALCVASVAHATGREPQNFYSYVAATGTLNTSGVSGVALSTSPSTSAIDTLGYSVMTISVDLTRVATTSIIATCSGTVDGTNYDNLKTVTFTSGAGALTSEVLTYTTSTTGTFIFPPITIHHRKIKCVFTGASAGASDLVSANFLLGVI